MKIEPTLFKIPATGTASVRQIHDGVQVRVEFPNGYMASVVCHSFSYGHEDNLWELAVKRGDNIVYDTPITSDVEGHLTPERVAKLLNEIAALKPA